MAQASSIFELSERDLKGNPYRLNAALKFLAELIARIQGMAGPVTFGGGAVTFNGPLSAAEGVAIEAADGKAGLLHLPVFADNAAAKAGDPAYRYPPLEAGQLYRTASGQVMVVY